MDPGPWIPIVAIAVGGLAIAGKAIVQPIVQALLKMNEQKVAAATPDLTRLEEQIRLLEERLGGMERSVGSLLEDRDFYRQLAAGEPRRS